MEVRRGATPNRRDRASSTPSSISPPRRTSEHASRVRPRRHLNFAQLLPRSAALLLLLLAGAHGLRPAPTARPTIPTRSAAPLLAAEPVSADSTAGNVRPARTRRRHRDRRRGVHVDRVRSGGPAAHHRAAARARRLRRDADRRDAAHGRGFALAPTSYEVMPFLAKFAAVAAAAGVGGASLLATVLAGSLVVGLLGAALVALSARRPSTTSRSCCRRRCRPGCLRRSAGRFSCSPSTRWA